jgi:hypothetical protein
MDEGNTLPSEHGLRDCAACSNRAVPAFYGDAIRHCSPQTTFIWGSVDFLEIGGGPALGRVGFSIAAARLVNEARDQGWQAIDGRARRWQLLR